MTGQDHFKTKTEKNLFFQGSAGSTNNFCGQDVYRPVDGQEKLTTVGVLSALPIF
jgi:hypothetical protein